MDHPLIMKAVEVNTDQKWILLYVRRWLAAPLQLSDGTIVARDRGTPQGSAVSPVLANLFLYYAFDLFMAREFPSVRFERYADDAVVHCATRRQAEDVLNRSCCQDGGGRPSAAPRQDKGGVLQGRQPAGLSRAHGVHVPWV